MKTSTAWTVFCLVAAVLGVLFFWPLWRVVSGGFFVDGHLTLRYLGGVFQNPVYLEGLLNSLKIALGTTFLAMCIALPLAWLSSALSRRRPIFDPTLYALATITHNLDFSNARMRRYLELCSFREREKP